MVLSCIEYTGSISNAGYGLTYDPTTKKTISAHRLAFRESNGYLPSIVMHSCNNKKCINPLHLIAGTQSDNIKASYRDGLQINSNRKLDITEVQKIYISPLTQRELAREYNVTQRVIWSIKNGETYKEVTGHGGSCGV